MGIVAIKQKEDEGGVHFMAVSKWDESFDKLSRADLVVRPTVGGCCDC
jgi:hypothetical protein